MYLSISNIAWDASNDEYVYGLMKKYGYLGLEIAPTRVFPNNPYDHLKEAKEWVERINNEEGLTIPSMQSIWFGRKEKIFGTEEERQFLIGYTKKAIDFAEDIGCNNLVFGCPQNRNITEDSDLLIALPFFKELGDYAVEHNTVIGLEANPRIYNTNYINSTKEAIELLEQVDSSGFKMNLDVGTMIQNDEHVESLVGYVHLINHVHISEPELKMVKKRNLHRELMELLLDEGYSGFVSIEMGKRDNLKEIEEVLKYVNDVFS